MKTYKVHIEARNYPETNDEYFEFFGSYLTEADNLGDAIALGHETLDFLLNEADWHPRTKYNVTAELVE